MDFLLFKETSYIIKIHSENLHYKTAKCIICANEFIDTMNTIVVSFCEVYFICASGNSPFITYSYCGADIYVGYNYPIASSCSKNIHNMRCISRHTVVCRAAQENGARANGSEYINRNNKVAIFTHS